jgi:hypothetical protein
MSSYLVIYTKQLLSYLYKAVYTNNPVEVVSLFFTTEKQWRSASIFEFSNFNFTTFRQS